jgi:hypothetical protein
MKLGRLPSSSLKDSVTFEGITINSVTPVSPATVATVSSVTTLGTSSTVPPCSSTCFNALIGADFTYTVTTRGVISGVKADLQVTDIAACSPVMVTQAFNVKFKPDSEKGMADNPVNTVARKKSGNPGFIKGSPLAVGKKVTNGIGDQTKAAVAMKSDGLSIAVPGWSGYCDSVSSKEVLFGIDTLSSCKVSLTAKQLKDLCKANIPGFLNVTTDLIGVFGNANPLVVGDWIEVTTSDGGFNPRWNAEKQTCTDLITSLHYDILVSSIGATNNLQKKVCLPLTLLLLTDRLSSTLSVLALPYTVRYLTCPTFIHDQTSDTQIISVRARYGASTWGMRVPTQATIALPDGQSQIFTYKTTVSFITMAKGAATEFTPPTPKVLPDMPYDLLYPFELGSRPSSNNASNGASLISQWSMVILAVLAFVLIN